MRTLLKYVIALPVVYLAAWTMAYAGIFLSRGDGLDFSYYFAYLGLAWAFRGGELPTFIWYFSLLLFLPLAVTSIFLREMGGKTGEICANIVRGSLTVGPGRNPFRVGVNFVRLTQGSSFLATLGWRTQSLWDW